MSIPPLLSGWFPGDRYLDVKQELKEAVVERLAGNALQPVAVNKNWICEGKWWAVTESFNLIVA